MRVASKIIEGARLPRRAPVTGCMHSSVMASVECTASWSADSFANTPVGARHVSTGSVAR